MQASAASTPVGQQLSDDLLAVIRTVMRAGGGRFLTVIEEHDISMTAMKLLMTLDATDSDLPVSKVAASLGLSLAATSRAVEDAVKRGFVSRTEADYDRRVKLLALTADGDQLVEQLNAARREGADAFVARLTDEQCAHASAALKPLLELMDELACTTHETEGTPA